MKTCLFFYFAVLYLSICESNARESSYTDSVSIKIKKEVLSNTPHSKWKNTRKQEGKPDKTNATSNESLFSEKHTYLSVDIVVKSKVLHRCASAL